MRNGSAFLVLVCFVLSAYSQFTRHDSCVLYNSGVYSFCHECGRRPEAAAWGTFLI